MDDIDRLSLDEVQSTFRLIKLSGSLKYITYVLAFDDKMVAAAFESTIGSLLPRPMTSASAD
jgi:predicted KAP-like P-loop ATPase